MTDINAMMSQMMRSGQLSSLGFGLPVKTLAVVEGKDYQKDHALRNDSSLLDLYRSIQNLLPAIETSKYEYRCTFVADECLSMCLFEQRLKGDWSDEIKRCMICQKKGKLSQCARCHQVSYCSRTCQAKHWKGIDPDKKWAHKRSCKLLAAKPRVILNDLPDSTTLETLGICGQGFVLIKKVEKK